MTKTLFALCISLIIIAACTAHRKSTSTASTTTVTTTTVASTTTTTESTPTVSAFPSMFVKPADGIYAPRTEELVALQTWYKEATLEKNITLEKLTEGYTLYAKTSCTKCHEALNIYYIDPFRWGFICDNMSLKAALTPTQKEAVYQYVLAIKAAK